jgi:hypothetical protein
MANTTNYNWETPDDTDLVKDGAAAIRTLGSSIDTTTKALNPETTLGDIAYRSSTSNTNTRLAIGSAGQVLTVAAGVPSWASPSDQTPLTTKGDVFTFSTVDARLGVGANGTVLTADSAETTGLKWAAPASGGGMTSLATGTLASAIEGASITSIAGTYNHLQLIVYNYTFSQDGYLTIRVNSDSGSNYQSSHQDFDASGTSADYNVDLTSSLYFNYNYNADATGSGYVAMFNIYNYANTTYNKHFFVTGSDLSNDASPKVSRTVTGRWLSNSAITSVQIRTEGSPTTFAGGSYILYGVK